MGCDLEDYSARVGTWAGRFSWRRLSKRRDFNGTTADCLGLTVLSFMALTVLLIFGGIEQNPGPLVEVENTVRLLYRMSQEECARLRESVPYVKVYRYDPKHLYPKLNGYGDNGQRKVRSSCGSTYFTCSADALRVYQNAQSAKLNQYFNTAGYSCAM